nr:hypothetical protein [Tanacetum cinerariifolium]
ESVAAKQSGDDAPIKERSINEGEVTPKRISDDSEELARVLTFMDAATVLAGGIDVPTGSGSIPTTGPHATDSSTDSEVAPTASLIELPLEKRIELISDLVKYQENYSKKQKTSEEAPEIEKSTEEIPEEKIKEMMQLVPVEMFRFKPFKSNILSLIVRFTQKDRGATGRSSGWEAAQLVISFS